MLQQQCFGTTPVSRYVFVVHYSLLFRSCGMLFCTVLRKRTVKNTQSKNALSAPLMKSINITTAFLNIAFSL